MLQARLVNSRLHRFPAPPAGRAGARLAVLVLLTATGVSTASITAGAAAASLPRYVALRTSAQAVTVERRVGETALLVRNGHSTTLQPLRAHRPLPHAVLFTTGAHARAALGAAVARSLKAFPAPQPAPPVIRSTPAPTTSTTTPRGTTGRPPTTTTAPASSTEVSTTTTIEPTTTTVPPVTTTTAPAPTGSGQVLFDDTFQRLDPANWNTFITSRAAAGWPWNDDGSGGSGPANPSVNYDAEYDLSSQVTTTSAGLVLTASQQSTPGRLGSLAHTYPWRSGVVSSYGHFQFDGGTLEITAKMPSGDGMWPGLWLLPGPGASNGDDAEIDLFEGGYTIASGSPDEAFAWHLHSGSGVVGGTVATGVDLTAAFHTYSLTWVPGSSITWSLDGRQIARVTSAQASIPDEPMELIMNLQVADAATAGWHTLTDGSTPASSSMTVREVKVTAP